MEDLELVLRQVTSDDGKSKKKLTRRFIIFEALSYNYGDIAPLPKIVKPFIDELFVICF
jgi:serine palmitoyltransferase